ncbi:hypothetical protein, partial [Segatella baroniae]|uniref:hypothetical protein n=1 Tax=Segatella baroniae TaxID=305719 RepID=UPI0012DC1F99
MAMLSLLSVEEDGEGRKKGDSAGKEGSAGVCGSVCSGLSAWSVVVGDSNPSVWSAWSGLS